jgi:alpha-ketoglutarate-dependent taurine dioxygenase
VTKTNSELWHSDIAFEPVPADYSSLRLVELPETGGGMYPDAKIGVVC